MEHLITKADLAEYDDFSGNIEDRIINPRINDAHTYDLRGLLSVAVLDSVYAATIPPVIWNVGTSYLAAAVVSYKGVVYDAVTDSTGIEPGTDTAYWKLNTGATLRYELLEPFLAWSTLRRYYIRAGRQNTPAGLTVPTDPAGTFQPISDKGRSELMAEAIAKADFHRQDILNFLQKNDLTHTGNCERGYSGASGRVWGI